MANPRAHEQFADEADAYLDTHNIYDLFSNLLKQLAIQKPKDPYSFLISALEQPLDTPKIIVVGPPGVGKATQLAKIVAAYGVVHLKDKVLVQDEIDQKSALADQLKECKEKGEVISDHLMTQIIATRLSKPDCTQNGWVLDGYPKTRTQAISLQMEGILPTNFIILDASSETCNKRAEESGTYDSLKDKLDDMTTSYHRNLKTIAPLYSPSGNVSFIDCEADADEVWSNVKASLDKAPASVAPRRPMRCLVLGAPGCGQEKQCPKIAAKFDLVYINVDELIEEEMRRDSNLKTDIEPYYNGGMCIPDDTLSTLVTTRLLQSDCRKRGWLLSGFPQTVAQANALTAAGIRPNRCIVLEAPPSLALSRVSERKYDPNSGAFHPKDSTAEGLITRPRDDENRIKTLTIEFSAQSEGLFTLYKDILEKFDATNDDNQLTEKISDFILATLGARNAKKGRVAV